MHKVLCVGVLCGLSMGGLGCVGGQNGWGWPAALGAAQGAAGPRALLLLLGLPVCLAGVCGHCPALHCTPSYVPWAMAPKVKISHSAHTLDTPTPTQGTRGMVPACPGPSTQGVGRRQGWPTGGPFGCRRGAFHRWAILRPPHCIRRKYDLALGPVVFSFPCQTSGHKPLPPSTPP